MSRVWSLLFACAFCLCCSGSLPGQGLHGLSPPMNLSVKSHNFHTVLKWAVVDASRTSRFNIDTSNYSSGIWKPYPPCFNISTHHCDLSDAFKLTLKDVTIYYARVKAVTTSQESAFAYTYGFTFKNNATLGPPTVHLAANGNEIAIEVKYEDPNSTESIKNALKNLAYNIYCWKPEDPKSESKKICSRQNRHPKITVTEGVTCVSAEVHLNKLQLKGERSQETCLLIQSNKHNLSDSRTFSWSPTLRRETYTIPQTPELEYSGKEGEEEYEDYPWSNDCLGNEESPGNEYYQNEYYQNEYYQEEMDAEEDEDPKDTSDELEHGTSHKFQPVNTEFSKGKIVAVLATVGVVLFMIGIIYFACNFNKKELLPKSLCLRAIMRQQ
uniref:interferon gamma receptor 1-like isoform X2 n=1 Tax=Pristiophorus japonicus TaxID=55135 RepID=UPI00398ED641